MLIEALKEFGDSDHIMIGERASACVPQMTKICGKGQDYMVYYCVKTPRHEGDCYCACKNLYFKPS